MKKSEQYLQIIMQTNEWFDKKREQLQLLIDNKNSSKISFEGEEGKKVDLPEDYKKGFYLGIETALEVLGEFPIKITKPNDNN